MPWLRIWGEAISQRKCYFYQVRMLVNKQQICIISYINLIPLLTRLSYLLPLEDHISLFIHFLDPVEFSPLNNLKSSLIHSSTSGWFSVNSCHSALEMVTMIIILSVFYFPLSPVFNLRCISSQNPIIKI